jgi:Flp pilus assembly CpaF family ATPase
MLTAEQAQQLTDAIRRGGNLLISGGTSAGKWMTAEVESITQWKPESNL